MRYTGPVTTKYTTTVSTVEATANLLIGSEATMQTTNRATPTARKPLLRKRELATANKINNTTFRRFDKNSVGRKTISARRRARHTNTAEKIMSFQTVTEYQTSNGSKRKNAQQRITTIFFPKSLFAPQATNPQQHAKVTACINATTEAQPIWPNPRISPIMTATKFRKI